MRPLHRTGEFDALAVERAYWAGVAGVEYTFFNVFDNVDAGVLLEALYDSRGERATTPFESDIFVGMRWVINDSSNTDIVSGVVVDSDRHDFLWRVEANRRLDDTWSLQVRALGFGHQRPGTPMYEMRNDANVAMSLIRWF